MNVSFYIHCCMFMTGTNCSGNFCWHYLKMKKEAKNKNIIRILVFVLGQCNEGSGTISIPRCPTERHNIYSMYVQDTLISSLSAWLDSFLEGWITHAKHWDLAQGVIWGKSGR